MQEPRSLLEHFRLVGCKVNHTIRDDTIERLHRHLRLFDALLQKRRFTVHILMVCRTGAGQMQNDDQQRESEREGANDVHPSWCTASV